MTEIIEGAGAKTETTDTGKAGAGASAEGVQQAATTGILGRAVFPVEPPVAAEKPVRKQGKRKGDEGKGVFETLVAFANAVAEFAEQCGHPDFRRKFEAIAAKLEETRPD